MNTERMERVRQAREYQKKAIRALLPENVQGHLDVVEKELFSIVKESVFEILQSETGMELMKSVMNMDQPQKTDREGNSSVKKVKIN